MKLIFYGSLNVSRDDFDQITQNLKSLIKHMCRERVEFVVRNINSRPDPQMIAVDEIVAGTLAEVQRSQSSKAKPIVTIFCEPGGNALRVPSDLLYKTYTASTTNRIQFYQEILCLVDIVIGVGGQHGLLRLAISCEWLNKPVFFLPGSGGTSEMLWGELFTKSYQILNLPEKIKNEIRETPYINCSSVNYPKKIFTTIKIFYSAVQKTKNPMELVTIHPNNITLIDLWSSFKRFSLGLWVILISISIAIITVSYSAGSANILNNIIKQDHSIPPQAAGLNDHSLHKQQEVGK